MARTFHNSRDARRSGRALARQRRYAELLRAARNHMRESAETAETGGIR